MKRSKFFTYLAYFLLPALAYSQTPNTQTTKEPNKPLDLSVYQAKELSKVFSIPEELIEFFPQVQKTIVVNVDFSFDPGDVRLSGLKTIIQKKLGSKLDLLKPHLPNELETRALFDWLKDQIEVNIKKKLQAILDLSNTNALMGQAQNEAELKKLPLYRDLLAKVGSLSFAQSSKLALFDFVLNLDQKNLNTFTGLYKLRISLKRSDGFIEGTLVVARTSPSLQNLSSSFLIDENRIDNMPKEVQNIISQLLFGYVPATLTYKLSPSDAKIEVPDAIETPDQGEFSWLEPKTYQALVYRQSYKPQAKEVVAESDKTSVLEVELEKTSSQSIVVRTEPVANIYDGGYYLGVSPQNIVRENNKRIMYSSAPDYQTNIFLVDPTDTEIEIDLTKSHFDRLKALDESRDQMYESLGTFAISLLLPIVFDALLSNQVSILGNGFANVDEKNKAYQLGTTYYYAKNIGILVSIGFGLRSFVKIVDYLHSADQLGLK